jgi:hypothetical protein
MLPFMIMTELINGATEGCRWPEVGGEEDEGQSVTDKRKRAWGRNWACPQSYRNEEVNGARSHGAGKAGGGARMQDRRCTIERCATPWRYDFQPPTGVVPCPAPRCLLPPPPLAVWHVSDNIANRS